MERQKLTENIRLHHSLALSSHLASVTRSAIKRNVGSSISLVDILQSSYRSRGGYMYLSFQKNPPTVQQKKF